jgi:hypothetical protein
MRLINWLLDGIAKGYLFFYHIFLQRPKDEPITRQADRFERKWPFLAWGFACLVFWLIDDWWYVPVSLFFIWWAHHITTYGRCHPGNEPYSKTLAWAERRLNARSH